MKMRRIVFLLGLGAFASIALAQTPGTFTPTGNLTTARVGHTATLLADGRVLIAGGSRLASAELYDLATGKFTAAGNMTSTRAGHTATLLPDGRVLIVGGNTPATSELYDPATGTFTVTGDMNGKYATTATLLPDGRVLIGGSAGSAQLYDPGTGMFTPAGNRAGFSTAALLADGRVLLAADDGYELYDPRTGTFSFAGTQNGFELRTILLMNGEALTTGGNDDPGPNDSAEVYDPSTGKFTGIAKMTAPRANHSATLLPDGKALIIGGSSWNGWGTGNLSYSCCLSSAELYDTATGLFASTGSMTDGRQFHTGTLLKNGEVLIAGGVSNSGGYVSLATAELYHPVAPIPAPALLSVSGDGQGQGAIQHAGTTRIASADDPAVAGESLSIYLTGLADGSVIPPRVAIGGKPAEITFFGSVPGGPGPNVVNVRMPSGVAPGPAVPVRLTYLDRPSNQVTIGVAEPFWQDAITAMKTAAATDSLNFWQWAWYWQYLPTFTGAPAGFGVAGSISPDLMERIITAGGGNPLQNISAEQWISYYRSATTFVSGVINAASHLAGAIAPGELVIVTGSGLGPVQVVSGAPDSDGVYAAQLAGTSVLINGAPVPLIYTSMSQVEAVVPDSIADGTAQIAVTYQGQTTASFPVPVAPVAPGIFTADSTGQGYAATVNQNGAVNAAVHGGDVVTLFATGLGRAPGGVTIHGFNLPLIPISVGKGTIPGVVQIKATIGPGQDCDTPVVIQVGEASSQPGVAIAVDICI